MGLHSCNKEEIKEETGCSFLSLGLMTCYALLLLWLFGYSLFIASITFMQPGKSETDIEAVIALTGGKDRLQKALGLMVNNKIDKLFISGTGQNYTVEQLTAAPALQQKITLGPTATNTNENATESKAWIDQHHITRFYLVTSNYHMARSMIEFKDIMPDKEICPFPVFLKSFKPGAHGYWRITFTEYNKTLYSWLRAKLTL